MKKIILFILPLLQTRKEKLKLRHEEYMRQAMSQSDAVVKDIKMKQAWRDVEWDEELDNVTDMVNSPPHYNKSGIECIDAIEAALTTEEFKGYCKGNNLKYTWRENYKNKEEDLKKAHWYLSRIIDRVDKDES